MCAQKLSAHRCYWGPFTIFLSKNYQIEYQSKKISNMQVWEMAMNFPELQMFSLPPLSFSDFCLLFVLLVLRKGFVVEIFAIHSGALLILAVCSFPPQVLPVHVHHTTLQLTYSSVTPCEMWVCGNSLLHTCYHGESLYMWGIAYSPRTKYELQRRAEHEVLMLKGDGSGFRKGTYMMVHFWVHRMWITAVLETKILKVPRLYQAPGDVEMLCWTG